MKKLVILLCLIVLSSPKIYSQLFVENFDYPAIPPTILSTTTPWSVASAGGTNPILVDVPGGLSFPQYAGSGVGNAVTLLEFGGEDDSASLSSRQTSGSVYASFMINVDSTQSDGDVFFTLVTTGNAFCSRVYIRRAGISGYNLGISKSAQATNDFTTAVYSYLTTYLVIAKYTFVAGPINDNVSLFVFDASSPPPAFEPIPTVGPITSATGPDATNLSRVLLRQGNPDLSANFIIDGIYVGTSYGTWRGFVNLTATPEGLYNTASQKLNLKDTVRVYLRNVNSPFALIDSSKGRLDSISLSVNLTFPNAPSGTYYIVVKHRNSIETWSKAGGENYFIGSTLNYNFTSSQSQSFGDNMALVGTKWTFFSGDVNQNGFINLDDVIQINNAASNFSNGYVSTDVDGNSIVELSDVLIAYNNSNSFVSVKRP